MMVALSGRVALVVTVENHKTMAKGGAQTPNHTMLHKMQIQKYSHTNANTNTNTPHW